MAFQPGAASDRYDVTSFAGIQAQRPMTVVGWVYRDATGEQDDLFYKRSGASGWQMIVTSSDFPRVTFFGVADLTASTTVGTGWVRIGWKVDASGNWKIFVDGAQDGSGTVGAPTTNATALSLGGLASASSDNACAEMAVWTTDLDDAHLIAMTSGFSPALFPENRSIYVPGVRAVFDVHGNTVSLAGSSSVFDHPRVFYAGLGQSGLGASAVAGTGRYRISALG